MRLKKTLVIGASEKPDRYSNKAIRMLRRHGHPVVAIGPRAGKVEDVPFDHALLPFTDIHTVTLYVGEAHQPEYYAYVLGLKPERIIFNPGTENEAFEALASGAGIECLEACTLVLLTTGQY